MPSDKAHISAIVKKRLQDRAKQVQGTVVLKDVIVVNNARGGVGEFYGFSTYLGHPMALRYEAEERLIKRMFQQIRQIAREVNFIHLDDNFEWVGDTLKMLPGKENHVTRVSFNEFYFYPYKKHGPLSQHGFDALIQKVDALAHALPENLHLVLASFPVMNAMHQVHNMVVHVQCGEEAKLYTFAKAAPSNEDVGYKRTIVPYFIAGHQEENLIRQMERLEEKITDQLAGPKPEPALEAESEPELGSASDSEEEAPPPVSFAPLVDKARLEKLKKILQLCEVDPSSDIFKSIKLLTFLGEANPLALELCLREMAFVTRELSVVIERMRKEAAERNVNVSRIKEGRIYSSKWGAAGQAFSGVNYGGFAPCVTKGGVEFLTTIDICLDHNYQLAKRMHEHQLRQNILSTPVFIAPLFSFILSSASFHIKNDSVLGESVVHADPGCCEIQELKTGFSGKKILVESTIGFANRYFGVGSRMFVYPERTLSPVGGVLGDTISRLNQFGEALKTQLMLAHRYPTQQDITQLINDIKLGMAVSIDDVSLVRRSMQANASFLHVNENGESTLALVKKSDHVQHYLVARHKIVNQFEDLISSGYYAQAIQLFDEALRCQLAQGFERAFYGVSSPVFRQALLRSAINGGDHHLMDILLECGADILMVDASTGLPLLNEVLAKDDPFHDFIKIIKKHFRFNLSITANQLIDALQKMTEIEKALRVYLLVAIDRKDTKLFSTVMSLGVDYLGEHPTAEGFIIRAVLDANHRIILNCIFSDAFKQGKLNALIDVILMCDIEDFDIITPIESVFFANHYPEAVITDLIQHLIKKHEYLLLTLMWRDQAFFGSLPLSACSLIAKAVKQFDLFQSRVRSGDASGVAESLKQGMSPNVCFEDGNSPVLDAIGSGYASVLKVLLEAGADLDVMDHLGCLPLRYAIHTSNWPAIGLICEYAEKTPKYHVLLDGKMIGKIKSRLLKDIGRFVSSSDCFNDEWVEVMDEAIDIVRKLDVVVDLNVAFREKTFMSMAIQSGYLPAARWLLDKGVSLDSVNEHGRPLLIMAICAGNQAIFNFFISRNVSLEAADERGKTPIFYAIYGNKPEMVVRLLELNNSLINLNEEYFYLKTVPLFYAVKKNYFVMVDALLSRGADINVAEKGTQRTALHIAVLKNDLGMVNFLLKKNADHTLCDASGLTPLGYARKFGCNDVILTLLTNARADAQVSARPRSPSMR